MAVTVADEDAGAVRRQARARLVAAVGRNAVWSLAGLNERLFARLFDGLVYAQIWEDPVVDMAAMALGPGHRVVTIASGGCNALSYLTADPARIEAVDLNSAHVAYNRLKIAALSALPDHAAFFRFFGEGRSADNIETYERHLRPRLDTASRAYWDGRGLSGRRRIAMFARDPYRHGVLGRFIGAGHLLARLYGIDLPGLLKAGSLAEQRAYFEAHIAPLFERRAVRGLVALKSTLFGLGIPPQQYVALAGPGGMAETLKARLRRLACDFPLSENYFTWQAFGRAYAPGGPLPPYLEADRYAALKARADRVTIVNASVTDLLTGKPDASVDRFVLLDAQDWMNDVQLGALWAEITRTAAPGARAVFRTAGEASPLPGQVAESLLGRWRYCAEISRELHRRDRSAIYGGFHLYALKD